MLGTAVCFALLELLPVDFPYWVVRRSCCFATGLCMAVVRLAQPRRRHEQPAAPAPRRRLGHEHDLPELGPGALHRHLLHPDDRRADRLACRPTCCHGLVAHGVPARRPSGVAHLPPVSTLFAAFLGYNPVQHLLGPHVLAQLTPAQQAALTGRSFFPGLIAAPFRTGLHAALDFAIVASLLAAWASWLRGGRYVYTRATRPTPRATRWCGRGDRRGGGRRG